MKICINDILYGFSVALDAVEGELVGATTYHSQRVAYICYLMGQHMGLGEDDLIRMVAAGLLHDNALLEFIQSEILKGKESKDIDIEKALGKHCAMGEANVKRLPFYEKIKDIILYHHERADGNGPFKKTTDETPKLSRIIHMADRADVRLDFSSITPEKYEEVKALIKDQIDKAFDREVEEAFFESITYERLKGIEGDKIVGVLFNLVPRVWREYTTEEFINFSDFFARIIDYKSPFTTRHSLGIAEKAKKMGEYYGWDEDTCNKLYFAGALHDIGKLLVNKEILEKPDRLTDTEYKKIQNHAVGSYVILNSISGIEDITSWACLHHEKLDGSGYPFGYTSEKLGKKERLMACLDIYQALVEERPYKAGMPHEKAMEILRSEVAKGKLDSEITEDINKVFG